MFKHYKKINNIQELKALMVVLYSTSAHEFRDFEDLISTLYNNGIDEAYEYLKDEIKKKHIYPFYIDTYSHPFRYINKNNINTLYDELNIILGGIKDNK